jgi:rubrerythrin
MNSPMSRREVLQLMSLGGIAVGLGLAAGESMAQQAPVATKEAVATGEKIAVKSTLENLATAFQGESNAHARYTAFAKKADEEGYGKVASLFRAAAKAESIHAKNHLAAIKKLGGQELKPELQKIEVKTTKENLEAAIKGETYEFKTMYPAFLAKARGDRKREAVRSFNYANSTEKGHAKLYKEALDNLEAWKGANVNFYVCRVCGNTVTQTDFTKCPVCFEPKTEYIAVK